MTDTRWLELRHRTYYAVKGVPRSLWKAVGKRRFVVSLQTQDLRVAQVRRHQALADIDKQVQAILIHQQAAGGSSGPVKAGLEWRRVFDGIKRGDRRVIETFAPQWTPPDPAEAYLPQSQADLALAHAEGFFWDQVAEMPGEDVNVLHPIAMGLATPISLHMEDWLSEGGSKGPLRPRTAEAYRRDIHGLLAWMAASGYPPNIEAIDRRVAGAYVGSFVASGANRVTANKKVAACSAYWRWLDKRGLVAGTPWAHQRLSQRVQGEKTKRAFTDHELALLLDGPAPQDIADVIRIGVLGGFRIEEIFQFRVGDVRDGWWSVKDGKTINARRRVPIHPLLRDIVQRRTQGKPADVFLLNEGRGGAAKVTNGNRGRSTWTSQKFTRYRRSVGVDDQPEGVRSSRVDFHSCRRWCATALRRAGVDAAVVSGLLGHARVGNLVDDVYSDGPGDEVLRQAIERLRLPADIA